MWRLLAGLVSALLLATAGFFFWSSQAEQELPVPPAPRQANYLMPSTPLKAPPAAPEKKKEAKRFARADKDEDGRITRAEMLQPRQKAFAKLDANGNGSLSFDEWAMKTSDKFTGADADKSGWLTPAEYAATRPKRRAKPKCAC